MKKLLISFLLIGVTGVIAFGASSAYFSDEVTVEDNTFAAGTIELDVQDVNEANETYSFSNIKPGDTGGWSGYGGNPQYSSGRPFWTVENVGSLPGTLFVSFDIQDYDAEGEEIPMADGAMSWAMRIQYRKDGAHAGEGHLGRNNWDREIDLDVGESVTLDYAWHLNAAPSEAIGGWNVLQGRSTEFDVNFYLEQQNVVTVE